MQAHNVRAAPLALAMVAGSLTVGVGIPATKASRGGPAHGSSIAAIGPSNGANWQESVAHAIWESERAVSWQSHATFEALPPAWQAPNRRNGLRVYFLPEGACFVPRFPATPGWRWGLSLVAFGWSDEVRPVPHPELEVGGPRVCYRRAELDEWYVNDERGVEHGFSVSHLPANDSDREGCTLVFRLATTGDLTARPSNRAIDLLTPAGNVVLRYGELAVFDADGRTLPSRLAPGDRTIDLEVDVSGARLPITVDPLVAAPEWAMKCEQDEAYMGLAVASAGDVNGDGYADVAVGAPYFDGGNVDEGRAFVFHGGPEGLLTPAAWTAEGDQDHAHFGYALGAAGDVNGDGCDDIVVGAPHFDGVAFDTGRAWVFLGSRNGLSQHPAWSAAGEQSEAHFGASVAGVGDVNGDHFADIAVGSPGAGRDHPLEGRVDLYLGAAGGLSRTAAWVGEGHRERAHFGHSLAGAGDIDGDGYDDVIVGAPSCACGDSRNGSAFVFRGGVRGLSVEPAWTGEGGQNAALFGVSVAGAGDVNHDGFADIIVGASGFDNGETNEGRAVVFLGGQDGLGRLPQWSAEGNQGGAQFGWSVAGAGDVNGDGFADIVVGARDFSGTYSGGGRVSVYYGSLGGLGAKPAWSADGEEDGAHLGWSVASAGDVNGDGCADVVVGAPHVDLDGPDVGGACIFYGAPLGMTIVSNWAFEGGQDGAELGLAVAGAGDVNGDGFDDVLVGAPGFDSGETDEGQVFLFYGSEDGLEARAAWSAEGNRSGARFGAAVSGAGDINGDGYTDVTVGAPGFSGDRPGEGRVFVFAGTPEGPSFQAVWTASGQQEGAQFGASVAVIDVNGDRYGDLVVGVPGFDAGAGDEGLVQVFQGSATLLDPTPTWSVTGNGGGSCFGAMVASAGDTDGDGHFEVAITAPGAGGRGNRPGLVSVFRGSASGLTAAPVWTVSGQNAQTHLGLAVAGAGDVDRDGFADLIVGAPGFDGTEVDEGAVFLFRGSPSGLMTAPAWTTVGGNADAQLGSSVAAAGDLDGDGYPDIVVGAPALPRVHHRAGVALVFQGCSSGLRQEPAWTGEGAAAGDRFGAAVSGVGDVNRDGFPDILVGAPGFDGTSVDEGRAYGFHGSALGLTGGGGLPAGVHTVGGPLPARDLRPPAKALEPAPASALSALPQGPTGPSLRGRHGSGRPPNAPSRSFHAANRSFRSAREPCTFSPHEPIGAGALGSAHASCAARLSNNRREGFR